MPAESATSKRPIQLTSDNSLRVRLGRKFMYFIGQTLLWGLTVKLTTLNIENVPPSGPTILLFNHVSQVDPPLVGAWVKGRQCTPIGKEELSHNPLTAWMVWMWDTIPIKRGELDMTALRRALYVLEHTRDVLMIAPEGHRYKALSEPKEGFVMLAAKTNAVIVPAAISGTQYFRQNLKRFKRTPVMVNYGRPVRLKGKINRSQYRAVADELMYMISGLLVDPSLRGKYSDLSQATMNYIEYV
jgi:1-acyl-sn-glycerol-3-phosphate acyltransferase